MNIYSDGFCNDTTNTLPYSLKHCKSGSFGDYGNSVKPMCQQSTSYQSLAEKLLMPAVVRRYVYRRLSTSFQCHSCCYVDLIIFLLISVILSGSCGSCQDNVTQVFEAHRATSIDGSVDRQSCFQEGNTTKYSRYECQLQSKYFMDAIHTHSITLYCVHVYIQALSQGRSNLRLLQ